MESSDRIRRPLAVRRVDSAETAPRVRHVDQLSDEALERFVAAVDRAPPQPITRLGAVTDGGAVTDDAFLDGEVIVFTDYYRVELR